MILESIFTLQNHCAVDVFKKICYNKGEVKRCSAIGLSLRER